MSEAKPSEEKEDIEKEEEAKTLLDYKTDRLAIAPGQLLHCTVCEKECKTDEQPCFVCFPPFGLDISIRIIACADCWQRVRWDYDEKSGEIFWKAIDLK